MDAISAHQDVRSKRHARRVSDGGPDAVVVLRYTGNHRPVTDQYPSGWNVIERGERGALHVGAQQAQDIPAGKPGEPAVVEPGRGAPRRIDILDRLDTIGSRCETWV